MKKRAIPRVASGASQEQRAFDDAVKENLEVITGRRGTPIEQLKNAATNAEIIAKINEIIERLQ